MQGDAKNPLLLFTTPIFVHQLVESRQQDSFTICESSGKWSSFSNLRYEEDSPKIPSGTDRVHPSREKSIRGGNCQNRFHS